MEDSFASCQSRGYDPSRPGRTRISDVGGFCLFPLRTRRRRPARRGLPACLHIAGNRPVNSERSVNQRFREFWSEIPGREGNLGGSVRARAAISRNRDPNASRQVRASRCNERPVTRNARRPISRGRALTHWPRLYAENKKAPRQGLEPWTRGLTVQH
jgi:hypothetical protein